MMRRSLRFNAGVELGIAHVLHSSPWAIAVNLLGMVADLNRFHRVAAPNFDR